MPQSLSRVYLHIVFGTKHWKPLIYPPYEADLYKYLAGVCDNVNCPSLTINGYVNHVHILCRLSKNIAISKLLEELKTTSSRWMKKQGKGMESFFWQDGYAAFGVCESAIKNVGRYIDNQHAHHTNNNYREEIIRLLEDNGVEYDERYFWD